MLRTQLLIEAAHLRIQKLYSKNQKRGSKQPGCLHFMLPFMWMEIKRVIIDSPAADIKLISTIIHIAQQPISQLQVLSEITFTA